MNRRPLFSALVGLLLLFSAVTANAASLLDNIMERKTLRVAVPVDYPPYGHVGGDMRPQGLDIDIANLLGEKMGVAVDLIPVTGPNRVPYLQTGRADMTISSLGKTPERSEVIDFSIAYAPFFDAVFGGSDVEASSFEELSGKTIAVTRGSMQDDELTELAPNAVIRRFEDNNSSIAAYMSGQTQLVAIGTTVASALEQRNPNLDLQLKVILSNSPCYIGMPKNQPELVSKVNEILRAAKADGTLDKISEKWLGAPAGDLPE